MFDIGWSEMAVIALVALVVIGPKDLPKVIRTVGQWVGRARSMAREFQGSVDQMVREAELDEVRKQMEKASSFNPEAEFNKAVDPQGDLNKMLDPKAMIEGATGNDGVAGAGGAPGADSVAAIPYDETYAGPVTEPAPVDTTPAEPVQSPSDPAVGKPSALA